MENNFILLIDCEDAKGLIHKITGVLFERGLNIVRNDEYVSKDDAHFFMRSEVSGNIQAEEIIKQLKPILPAAAKVRLVKKENKKIVVMATKEHHCLSELITRTHYKELNAEIIAIVSNYNSLEDLAQKFNVPFHYVSHEGIERPEHEKKILQLIKSLSPDYIVLAKYMRILSPDFVREFPNKIINIHHSFLPAFIGANPYKQAYQRGVKIIGATAHMVNDQLDEGPIIAQSVIPVGHWMDASDMALAGKDIEKMVLSNALKAVIEERIFVHGNRTVVFD